MTREFLDRACGRSPHREMGTERVPKYMNATCLYARGRTVAISPLNPHPAQTLFHEMAHVLRERRGTSLRRQWLLQLISIDPTYQESSEVSSISRC
jgi:hypothetical protein